MSKLNTLLRFLVYSYIALPFMIFAAGFTKLPFAIIFTFCIAAALILSVNSSKTDFTLPFRKTDIIRIFGALAFITLMVLLSGIGNVFWQNNDHATRNTIFDILVSYSWPPKAIVNGESTGLVYYIGFWLPSALIGKIAGLGFGYIFQIIWAVLGLFILWYLLCLVHKKFVLYPLVIFMLFSGFDVLGHLIVSEFFAPLTEHQIGQWAFSQGSVFSKHLEWWAHSFQYSSHTTQLFWVFNQCIPVWIATSLILLEKNNKNLVFIMGLTLISSSLPFIGLIPVFVWAAVTNHNDPILNRSFTKTPIRSFLSMFTFQNVAGGGISGIVTFLYLKSNIATTTAPTETVVASGNVKFSVSYFIITLVIGIGIFALLRHITKNEAPLLYLLPILPLAYLIAKSADYKIQYYLWFIILEVVVLAAPTFPVYGKSSLYALCVSGLLVIPFFTIGKSIDFCMRASIPLLVILCLFATTALETYLKEKKLRLASILIAVLLIGSLNSFHEITRTLEATAFEVARFGRVMNDSKKVETVFKGKNFTGKTKDNFFFNVIAK